jgi:hypothetical protein
VKIVYIAHRLGCGPDREHNREAAARWVAWAALQGVAPVATWITLAAEWTEDRRELGLSIDLELIRRCDEIWLCGPVVSAGMRLELEAAERWGLVVRRFETREPSEEKP